MSFFTRLRRPQTEGHAIAADDPTTDDRPERVPSDDTPGDAFGSPGGDVAGRSDGALGSDAASPGDNAPGDGAGGRSDGTPADEASSPRGDAGGGSDGAPGDDAGRPGNDVGVRTDGAPGDDADSLRSGGAGDADGAGKLRGDGDGDAAHDPGGRRGLRAAAAAVTTALASMLVLFALMAPNQLSHVTPGAFVRVPVEALLGVALVLVVPARARRVVAVLVGVVLGLLTIVKIIDMGFFAVFDRPFDLVFDWSLFEAGLEFLRQSIGRTGAVGAVIAAAVLAVALLVLMTLSVLRLTRLVVRHDTVAIRAVAVLGLACVACAALGVRVFPDVPAAGLAYDRVLQVRAGLNDKETFAGEAAVDAFRDTPGKDLLTALRGKDVMVVFIESYGRSAVEDPRYATQVGAVLDAGNRRLRAAGYASRSGFLTSSTIGGGSWWAHSTLLSGVWVNNQHRYHKLVASDRLTLNGAFRRAGWRTVGVMPGITQDWPEGPFFGYDQIHAAKDLGYHGPLFPLATMPDQYTLSAFQRLERARRDHAPLMAEMPLTSSHAPWAPIPRLIDWNDVGDGSIFNPMAIPGNSPEIVMRDADQVRTDYRRSIEYSLNTLISYVETYGGEDLVLVFLGDHQPSPLVTGEGASRDVPITIVADDRAVLDRISGWGWHDGLKPGPQAPVWPMDTFRDRFLTTFGPQPGAAQPPTR